MHARRSAPFVVTVASLVGFTTGLAPSAAVADRNSGASGINAARAATVKPVEVSKVSVSRFRDDLMPLAGTASTLVYAAEPSIGTAVGTNDLDRHLTARLSNGTRKSLGVVAYDDIGWSLVGHGLTALRNEPSAPRPVDWWNTATGRHGSITLHGSYLSAAPHGFLSSTHNGELRLHTLGGHAESLGRPFGDGQLISSAAAGPDGVVLVDNYGPDPGLAYLSWKQPGSPIRLDSNVVSGGNGTTACSAVNSQYAACVVNAAQDAAPDGQGLVWDGRPVLVPLDGSAATFPCSDSCPSGRDALAGNTLIYTQPSSSSTNYQDVFSSIAPGDTTSTTSTVPAGLLLVSAYGETVAQSPSAHSLLAIPSVDEISTLITAHRSPINATSFALTSGRIAWLDDQTNPARPNDLSTIRSRDVRRARTTIRLGKPSVVAGDPAGPSSLGHNVLISGPVTAWENSAGDSVTVRAPHRRMTIAGSLQAVSSRYVVVATHGFTSNELEVLDLHTRRVTDIGAFRPIALSGHNLAFIGDRREIYVKDLRTGRQRLISATHSNAHISIAGRWVGWDHAHFYGRLLDLRHPGHTVKLHRSLVSVTKAGALLSTAGRFREYKADVVPLQSAIWLRSHSGRTRKILSERAFPRPPQATRRTLAWLNPDGELKISQL